MSKFPSTPIESTRRTFLGAAAGVAGATGSVFAGESSAATDGYGTVVDVTDAGADNTGQEPINPVLDDLRRKYPRDTLFVFPQGTYAMDSMFRFTDFEHVGFVGHDATIVPTSDFEMSAPWLFRLGVLADPGYDLTFEGFTFDFTEPDTGVRAIEAQVTDGLEVRDVTVRGFHDTGTLGPAMFNVLDADGWGEVHGLRLPDGGAYTVNTDGDIDRGPTGILVSPYHNGTLRLRHCVVDGFPDNGLYADTPDGRILVEGGLYRNSNVANIRVAGDNSSVRWATVVVDENRPEDNNQRGIRVDDGEGVLIDSVDVDLSAPNGYALSVLDPCTSVKIRDSDFSVADRPNSAVVVSSQAGRVTFVDSGIHFNGSGYAVAIFGDDPGEVVLQDITISGWATGEAGRSAILCHRDNCEFRDLSVYQPGQNRRGIDIHGDDCLLVFGEYMASNYPIYNTGDRTRIYDLAADSWGDDEALFLLDGSNLEIVRNVLKGWVRNDGATYEKFYGNTTS